MECEKCGYPDSTACACASTDLLGFLSDFRRGQAPEPEPVPAARAAWTRPATTPDEVEPEEYYAEPGEAVEPETYLPPVYEVPTWPPHPPSAPTGSGPWPAPATHLLSQPYTAPSPPRGRRRGPSRVVVSAAIAAVLVLASGFGVYRLRSGSGTFATLSAEQILQKALSAATQAATAHMLQLSSAQGNPEQDSIEISPEGGTVDSVVSGRRANIVSVAGTMYIKADSWILGNFGFPSSVSNRYAGRWLSVPTTIEGIRQASEELQTPIVISKLLTLAGPLTKVASSDSSQVTLRGAVPSNDLTTGNGAGDVATLVVSAKSPHYPLSLSFSDPQNGPTKVTFSGWGLPVDLTPPSSATPIRDLAGKAS